MFNTISGRITYIIIFGMTKGDIAYAPIKIFIDKMDIISQSVTVFNSDINGAFAFFFKLVCIVRGGSNLCQFFIPVDDSIDRIYYVMGFDDGLLKRIFISFALPKESREKLSIQTAFFHPDEIHFTACFVRIMADTGIKISPHESHRRIAMGING